MREELRLRGGDEDAPGTRRRPATTPSSQVATPRLAKSP
jgi:hypothetical protein